jgi:hypothetical protein
MRVETITGLFVVLAPLPVASGSCDRASNVDAVPTCPAAAVDAALGVCRAPLSAPSAACASTWAEQKLRGCKPGVVVFVSAETPSARQWIWFERPWLSGGLSCFFDPGSGALTGIWELKDYPFYCCGTSYDVTYGDVDHDLHDAASRAASPWVGKLYDTDGTAAVEGGEVRYCASPLTF